MNAERADDSAKWIVRRAVKAAVAGALVAAGAPRVVAALRRRGAGGRRVLVLSYHRVSLDFRRDAAESLPSLLVSAETLHRQLSEVGRTHDVVSIDDACRILAAPEARGRDVVVITFDDGYVGVHDHGLPVLRDLRMPGVVYMATGFADGRRRLAHDRLWGTLRELWRRHVPPAAAGLPAPEQQLLDRCAAPGPAGTLDRIIATLPHDAILRLAAALENRLGLTEEDLPEESRLMTWEELRALEAGGIAVGGHTVSHAALANLAPTRARAEIDGCMRDLAANLRQRRRHFAYPNGYYTPAVKRMVAAAGFASAVTTEDAENRRGGDPYALKRKVLWENSTLGARGYSSALAACNLGGVFGALGWQQPVPGERPDAPEPAPAADQVVACAR
jgi:peptidoglycan/xylan/chitin deacetylase (PgdA/CDA1 family)